MRLSVRWSSWGIGDMAATVRLEAIGDDFAQRARGWRALGPVLDFPVRRPWVAEILAHRGGRWYERQFLDGQKDYSEANSIGSRGVYLYFHLREGRIYEVHELQSWRRSRRYFCTVSGGDVVEMSADEVQAALAERAEREAGLV